MAGKPSQNYTEDRGKLAFVFIISKLQTWTQIRNENHDNSTVVCFSCISDPLYPIFWPSQSFRSRNSAGVSRKAEDAFPTGTASRWSQFFCGVRVAYLLLLICMCDFSDFMFFVVYVFFHVWSLCLDYILLISTRILIPFITQHFLSIVFTIIF